MAFEAYAFPQHIQMIDDMAGMIVCNGFRFSNENLSVFMDTPERTIRSNIVICHCSDEPMPDLSLKELPHIPRHPNNVTLRLDDMRGICTSTLAADVSVVIPEMCAIFCHALTTENDIWIIRREDLWRHPKEGDHEPSERGFYLSAGWPQQAGKSFIATAKELFADIHIKLNRPSEMNIAAIIKRRGLEQLPGYMAN